MITSKWFRFIIAKIYNILRNVIARILRHMCNLHIKETEISQKRSKGIKNWKKTYSVILSVLSNKTNLILGFSSLLISRGLGVNSGSNSILLSSHINTIAMQWLFYTMRVIYTLLSSGRLLDNVHLSIVRVRYGTLSRNHWDNIHAFHFLKTNLRIS